MERARRSRTDFNEFVPFVMRDEKGRPITQASLHRVWDLHVRTCWKAGLNPALLAPFAHGKTVQCVVGRVAWEVGRDPTIRVKVVCNADKKAKERVTKIGDVLKSPRYRRAFPAIRPVPNDSKFTAPKWSEHDLLVARPGDAVDPTVQARGVLTTGTGGRADLIVFDDVVDHLNAIVNPAMREKIIEAFFDVWMSRLDPGGRALYIGTPWHEADLTHRLMHSPGWCTLRMPIAEDFSCIEMEVYNPPANYPLPAFIEEEMAEAAA